MNLALYSREFVANVWPALAVDVQGRLGLYVDDLLRYNRAQNLVSRRDPERQIARLVEECVAAGLVLERRWFQGLWADVGSGAGIPGLVLASMFPEQPLTLIERRQGRCDFLRRESSRLDLPRVRVFEGDVADWSEGPFQLVLAKAVANPGEIERLCSPVVDGTLVVFGRPGANVDPDWREAWTEPLPGEGNLLRGLVRS